MQDRDDDGDDVEEGDGQAQALFCKKGKSKKKPGRKTNWSKAATNDLVDIVVNFCQHEKPDKWSNL